MKIHDNDNFEYFDRRYICVTTKVPCGERIGAGSERDAILNAIEHKENCTRCQRILKLNNLKK